MVSLHPAAMNWGLTHTTPSPRSPGYKPPLLHQSGVQHEVLLTESGFLGKQLLAAGPPIAGGGGSACTQLRSHVGACVGCESFSGAWSLAGLASKASLDVRRWRTTLIYSYSFFPDSCVAASPPAGPSEENPALCCLWIQP